MAVERRADAVWNGDLTSGTGTVSASTSSAFSGLPVTWASRTEDSNGRTSPEELIAAAHAACFSMAFSSRLAKAGFPADQLDVSATVTFDKGEAGWRIASSALRVRGKVPGIDADRFRQEADAAKDGCPVSQALTGNVRLSVDAALAD